MQPVDLAGAHRTQLAPVAREQAQFAQILGRDEAGPEHAESGQDGQPLAVGHVGLATGHVLDPVRVDDPGGDAGVLQVGVHALPVDAGALHDRQFDVQLDQPGGKRPAVAPKAAELSGLALHRTVGLLEQHGDHVLHAVHVDTGHAPVQRAHSKIVFHHGAPVVKVPVAHRAFTYSAECKVHPTEGWKTPRIVTDSGLFTVRAATRPRSVGHAARQSGVRASPVQVRLGNGVGPSNVLRPHAPGVPPRHGAPLCRPCARFLRGGFHGRGRLLES